MGEKISALHCPSSHFIAGDILAGVLDYLVDPENFFVEPPIDREVSRFLNSRRLRPHELRSYVKGKTENEPRHEEVISGALPCYLVDELRQLYERNNTIGLHLQDYGESTDEIRSSLRDHVVECHPCHHSYIGYLADVTEGVAVLEQMIYQLTPGVSNPPRLHSFYFNFVNQSLLHLTLQ